MTSRGTYAVRTFDAAADDDSAGSAGSTGRDVMVIAPRATPLERHWSPDHTGWPSRAATGLTRWGASEPPRGPAGNATDRLGVDGTVRRWRAGHWTTSGAPTPS